MQVTDAMDVLIGVAIGIGLLGIVVPLIPGTPLLWIAILIWSTEQQTTLGWVVLALATAAVATAQVARILLPGRRLRAVGVPRRSLGLGVLLGLVGFFVVPVLGLVIGFLLGVYLSERHRLGSRDSALASTRSSVRAVGASVLIELLGGLVAAGVWFFAVLTG
jgi:uncharacterized protein YqgC (DUF456 family)